MRIDLNSDLGGDPHMRCIAASASIAYGGHAGDPDTMFRTLPLARDNGVSVGAHDLRITSFPNT